MERSHSALQEEYYFYKKTDVEVDVDKKSQLTGTYKALKTNIGPCYCLAANNKYIAIEQVDRLSLISDDYWPNLYYEWRTFVIDMFWSSALGEFIVIDIDCIHALVVDDERRSVDKHSLGHEFQNHTWWCGTSSNNTLFLSESREGTSLFEYTLKPKIALVKEHQSPISCAKDEFICNMSSNTTLLALMIIKQRNEIRLDLCALDTLERQRLIKVDSTYLMHPFRSCPIKNNRWILVNPNQSELWYISKDGEVISKENYVGTPRQVALMDDDTLAVLTLEGVNIHQLSTMKTNATN